MIKFTQRVQVVRQCSSLLTMMNRSYATQTKLEQAAVESKEKLVKWITDTKPALSDDDVVKAVSPLIRPFAKQRVDEMRHFVDHYAVIREQELIRRGVMKPTERSPSLILKLFGYYRLENRMEQTIDNIWDTLEKHISAYFPSKIYTSYNLPTPEENWLNSEFYIWTFHLWALYRRLRFEGKEGELIASTICDRFWKICEFKLNAVGIPGSIIHTQLRRMQALHYGVCIALDEGLALDQDTDAIWAEVVWRNLYSAGYEAVVKSPDGKVIADTTGTIKRSTKDSNVEEQAVYIEARYLLFWVRYLRYLLSWFDHIDSTMLLKGVFELHSPTSDLVQGSKQ